jgi:hypothetical protein
MKFSIRAKPRIDNAASVFPYEIGEIANNNLRQAIRHRRALLCDDLIVVANVCWCG